MSASVAQSYKPSDGYRVPFSKLRLVNCAAFIPLSTGKGLVDECEDVLQGSIQWRSLNQPTTVRSVTRAELSPATKP